jgi:hypothetical protein
MTPIANLDCVAARGTRDVGESEPQSVAWASGFATGAPAQYGPVPGPASRALMARRDRHEFGDFSWITQMPIAFAQGLPLSA